MSPNPISLAIAAVLGGLGFVAIALSRALAPGAVPIALAVLVLVSLKLARQWEQAVVLRAGKISRRERPRLVLDRPDPR
jgi:regulator of protease activity HflC (stomatin/prohibitin superfamily)